MGSVDSDAGDSNSQALRPELPYKEERDPAVVANGMGLPRDVRAPSKSQFRAISRDFYSTIPSIKPTRSGSKCPGPITLRDRRSARFSPRLRYAVCLKSRDWAMRAPAAPERLPRSDCPVSVSRPP